MSIEFDLVEQTKTLTEQYPDQSMICHVHRKRFENKQLRYRYKRHVHLRPFLRPNTMPVSIEYIDKLLKLAEFLYVCTRYKRRDNWKKTKSNQCVPEHDLYCWMYVLWKRILLPELPLLDDQNFFQKYEILNLSVVVEQQMYHMNVSS